MTSIWDFACEFYARPGVAAACLALQDRGVEVTTLLAALWAGASDLPALSPDDFARIEARVGAIQRDVIVPLRRARVALKPLASEPAARDLREKIKRLELDAERLVLEAIADALPGSADRAGSARDNLMAYPATARLIDDEAIKTVLKSLRDWRKSRGI